MRRIWQIIAVILMLAAVGCGGVEFENTDFSLPDDTQGPEYGAESP